MSRLRVGLLKGQLDWYSFCLIYLVVKERA